VCIFSENSAHCYRDNTVLDILHMSTARVLQNWKRFLIQKGVWNLKCIRKTECSVRYFKLLQLPDDKALEISLDSSKILFYIIVI